MQRFDARTILAHISGNPSHIEFHKIEVFEDLTLEINQLNYSLSFQGCVFLKPVVILCKADNLFFDFSGSTFESTLEIKASSNFRFISESAKLKKDLTVSCKKGGILELEKTFFYGNVSFRDSELSRLNFDNSVFQPKSVLEYINCNTKVASFRGATFQKVYFFASTFETAVSFNSSVFTSLQPGEMSVFTGTTFKDDVAFDHVYFDQDVDFRSSTFHGTTRITNVDGANSCTDFSGSVFFKKAFFNGSKFRSLIMSDVEFWEQLILSKVRLERLILSGSMFAKGSDFFEAQIFSADRETFRVIKNELLKLNNSVEALHYRRLEMDEYQKEIKHVGTVSERFLLCLNKLSNNHGISWLRGCIFTIAVSILAFSIYLLSLGNLPFTWGFSDFQAFSAASQTTMKYYVDFLIVTHRINFMEEFSPSACSYLIDFVGRIFIGYGIYQTIQAFRKYGKN